MNESIFRAIAERYGTPCYVYDLDTVTAQVDNLRYSLPEADLFYAVKANACGAVLRHLAKQNVGAEVISIGELERAVAAGVKNIILGGPRQDGDLIARALEVGVSLVSLDSVSQWEVWRDFVTADVSFVVRLNPALDPRTHEHLATGAAESKFGMTFQEAEQVATELSALGQLLGFHVHAGSQITESQVYDDIFAALTPLYDAFECSLLDIGGGFGVPGFKLETFAQKVKTFAAKYNLKVMLEPGRYLIADAGVLLTKVLHLKSGALNHVIADAGMADLLRPALYGAQHPIRVLGKKPGGIITDIDGPLCENADRLGRAVKLPELFTGDILVVEQAGAYGAAMSSNYASSLRPAEVVFEKGESRLARKRETPEDLMRLEL